MRSQAEPQTNTNAYLEFKADRCDWHDLTELAKHIVSLENYITKVKGSDNKYSSNLIHIKIQFADLAKINILAKTQHAYDIALSTLNNKTQIKVDFLPVIKDDKMLALTLKQIKDQVEQMKEDSKKSFKEGDGKKIMQDIITACDELYAAHFQHKIAVLEEFSLKLQTQFTEVQTKTRVKLLEEKHKLEIATNRVCMFEECNKVSMLEAERAINEEKKPVTRKVLLSHYAQSLKTINASQTITFLADNDEKRQNTAALRNALLTWVINASNYLNTIPVEQPAFFNEAMGVSVKGEVFLRDIIEIRNMLVVILKQARFLFIDNFKVEEIVKYFRQSINYVKSNYQEGIQFGLVYDQMLRLTEVSEAKLRIIPACELPKVKNETIVLDN